MQIYTSMFFTSETRKRHRYVDQTIENTATFLRKNQDAVINRIGVTAFQVHQRMTRRYFVPNMRHGDIHIPNRQSSNGIPVVALCPGERPNVTDDFFIPTAVQRLTMHDQLTDLGVNPGDLETVTNAIAIASIDSLQRSPRRFPGVFDKVTPRSPNNVMKATVYTPGIRQEIDLRPHSMRQVAAEQIVLGRSVLGLLYRGPQAPPLTASAMFHEQFHLMRAESQPLRPVLSREQQAHEFFREELRACHDGAQAVSIALDVGVPHDQISDADRYQLEVDRVRVGFNASIGLSADVFDPSIALMRALPTLAHDSTQPWN